MSINYSYLMGVSNVDELINNGFEIEEIDGDYGIKFSIDKEKQYEKFIRLVRKLSDSGFKIVNTTNKCSI